VSPKTSGVLQLRVFWAVLRTNQWPVSDFVGQQNFQHYKHTADPSRYKVEFILCIQGHWKRVPALKLPSLALNFNFNSLG
jgi:hypothetical protein